MRRRGAARSLDYLAPNRARGSPLGRPGGLIAPEEQPVEVGERELVPGRAAVVALAGALGFLHAAQERVHLRHRERTVRAHGAVAGHRREQLVAPLGEHAARAVLPEVRQQRRASAGDVAAGERARDAAHDDAVGESAASSNPSDASAAPCSSSAATSAASAWKVTGIRSCWVLTDDASSASFSSS